MKSYMDQASGYFEMPIDPEAEKFVENNIDIAVQITHHLKELGWSQKDFAKNLGKTEAEVSKWLSGVHNLTQKSIAKMETVLGKDILITPIKAKQTYNKITYVTLPVKPILPPGV